MFFLLYRHSDDGVFDNFAKISDHLPKISEDSQKLIRRSHERYRTLSENFRRSLKIVDEEEPKMSQSYINEFKVAQSSFHYFPGSRF